MIVENLLKKKIGEYLLKKYSVSDIKIEIIKTKKEFNGDYTVVLFPILPLLVGGVAALFIEMFPLVSMYNLESLPS